jgi:hypothetical protein
MKNPNIELGYSASYNNDKKGACHADNKEGKDDILELRPNRQDLQGDGDKH